ncbi:MAG: 2-methylaconitate cis-trans isomerase PrpF family protein [Nitrospinota bacterium]
MQVRIQSVFMRGGTSKGLFFREKDLPRDPAFRDAILLRVMGSPDPRQIDGLGSGFSSASKVAIVAPPEEAGGPVRYTFAQVSVTSAVVDYRGNCGNLSAAVGPFAIDEGMVEAIEPATPVKILNTNTGKTLLAEVPVRGGRALEEGDCSIAGVPGTGAPIDLRFEDPGGAVTGSLLPTGNRQERMTVPGHGVLDVSIVDAGNPAVFIRTEGLGLTGAESPAQIDADEKLLKTLEQVRGLAAERCGFVAEAGEAAKRSPAVPKVALVSPPPSEAGEVHLRATILSMGRAHKAYALTGAIATAVAAKIQGTVVHTVSRKAEGRDVTFRHPSGLISVQVEIQDGPTGPWVQWVKTVRTARRLMDGRVLVPKTLWKEQLPAREVAVGPIPEQRA